MDEEIIHVLMLNESAIQNATKFQGPHCRRSGSTGFKSWFVSCKPENKNNRQHCSALRRYFFLYGGYICADSNGGNNDKNNNNSNKQLEGGFKITINWALVSPGSVSTASLSAHRLTFAIPMVVNVQNGG